MNGWIAECRMGVLLMIEYIPAPKSKTSFSVPEMRKMLGLSKTEAYWLVKKNFFKTIVAAGRIRIMKDSFEEWYANQYTYQKVDGPPPGENLKNKLLSTADIAEILGIAEATASELVAKEQFELIYVYGKRRIVKSSFERWYQSQSFYRTVEDQFKEQIQFGETLTMPQIARLLGVHRNTVYYLVNKGCFEIISTARRKLVTKASFDSWYSGQNHYKKINSDGGEMDGVHC